MNISVVDVDFSALFSQDRHCTNDFRFIAKIQIALRHNTLERVRHDNDQFARPFDVQSPFLPANGPAARSQDLVVTFQLDRVSLISQKLQPGLFAFSGERNRSIL